MTKIIVRVHRPELTPEERARRMEEINDAAARLILDAEKKKREKLEEQSKKDK